jgi:RNA polymerase sigma-70 factor (ECF subfamily)
MNLEKLINRYSKLMWKIVSVCSPYLAEQDIEEICADVFIDFWKNRERYDESKSSIKTYLSAIAKNKAADFLRRYKPVGEIPENTASSEPTAELSAEINEQNEFLQTALDKITPYEKNLLLRRYADTEKPADIAASLGKNVKSVENSIYRAKKKLKGELL